MSKRRFLEVGSFYTIKWVVDGELFEDFLQFIDYSPKTCIFTFRYVNGQHLDLPEEYIIQIRGDEFVRNY